LTPIAHEEKRSTKKKGGDESRERKKSKKASCTGGKLLGWLRGKKSNPGALGRNLYFSETGKKGMGNGWGGGIRHRKSATKGLGSMKSGKRCGNKDGHEKAKCM